MHVDHSRPLFTVITAFGRPEYGYLRQAGESLLPLNGYASAEGAGVEWLIALNGTPDDPDATEEKVREALFGLPVTRTIVTLDEGLTGPGAARNAALEIAQGPWVITLDGDDQINADGITSLYEAAIAADADFAVGKTYDMDSDGNLAWPGPADPFPNGPLPPRAFWNTKLDTGDWPWHCCASVIRTDALRDIGGWADLPRNEDTAMMAVLGATRNGVYEGRYAHYYRRHPASLTADPDRWAALDERLPLLAQWVDQGRIS